MIVKAILVAAVANNFDGVGLVAVCSGVPSPANMRPPLTLTPPKVVAKTSHSLVKRLLHSIEQPSALVSFENKLLVAPANCVIQCYDQCSTS